MKRFKFSLDAPLRVKQKIEQIREQQLIEARMELEREKKELRVLEEKKGNIKSSLEQKVKESLKVAELAFFEALINTVNSKLKNQERKVAGAFERCKEAMEVYIISRRERQVIEKLKEKRFNAYLSELNREEQKILDDIASLAFLRRGEGEYAP
ncbi:MAG: flagellar export protein FliJ [Thermosediminibacteraceae bacterium]|nr:flagellar export protein FliJ [Thermosediminibacteraceae bacterium]